MGLQAIFPSAVCLARQGAAACDHALTSAWTCIVGRRSESEIAKPVSQFAEITRGMAQRLDSRH